jgi:eukaryotic-like serine/threonine-protein kinase
MTHDNAVIHGFNKQEPIPGYLTKELLGTGGYGEVWKAHAPGGLFKAIKFICAGGNAKRASRELTALNRIKEVRHPFLLSIERIEVVDGNVIIVTELADQSLKRYYQKQRAKGLPGLPREELLGYLRDTADALDYIYDNYSLQHLDIKPENLLLVGGRAKVADFGLIKNLYDRSGSRVEGLTPLYAAPELFEGKPHRHSDQYSLAIVYQEMLTGGVPFDGTTAAQLAAQHLHVAPSLSALPKGDQPVIARSLSKDPVRRFPNCRTLVEALVEGGKSPLQAKRESPRIRPCDTHASPSIPYKTEELNDFAADGIPSESTPWTLTKSFSGLPPIVLDDDAAIQYEPVLYIGIGGAATQVLQRVRRRLHDRVGSTESIPVVEMLLIDTDIKSLNRATEGEPGMAIGADERLPMPLRPSEDYRLALGSAAGSISRRWLFNVPYSLQTEGFRPLGRLALIDHSKRLRERLRQSLTRITSEESTARTAQATGREFVPLQPRVMIVASTAGGTGGGMVLDIAYAVRSILAELDFPDGNVHGILMHSTGRGSKGRDKAVANTYATLSELWHYSRPGQCYPGDRGCGIPAFHGNNRTFSSCYFVHLGDDLSELQFCAATDPVAEYLYSSTMTPASRFLDKCRHMEYVRWGTEFTEPLLRTFGLCQLGGSNSEIPVVFAELLCRDLVSIWRSGISVDVGQTATLLSITTALTASGDDTKNAHFLEIDSQAEATAVELGVDVDRMQSVAREILDQEVSTDIDSYCGKLVADILKTNEAKVDRGNISDMVAAIDHALAGSDDAQINSLNTVLSTRIEGRSGKVAASIRDWVFDLLDAPDGVAGAKHAAEWFQTRLRDLQATNVSISGRLREQALGLQHAILRQHNENRGGIVRIWPGKKRLPEIKSCLLEYARIQVEQIVSCAVSRGLRLIEAQVTAELDRLQVFWKDLNTLARAFHVPQSLDEAFDPFGGAEGVPSHWRELLSDLVKRRHDLVTALDRNIEEILAVGPQKLRWHLTEDHQVQFSLATPLRAAARQLILAAMQDLSVSRVSDNIQGPAESSDYSRCIAAAHAPLADQAAGTRLLLIVPQDIDAATIRQSLAPDQQQNATIVYSPDGEFIACEEAELLEVRRVGAALVNNRRDFIELAERLHTRVDVKWDDMLAGDPACK